MVFKVLSHVGEQGDFMRKPSLKLGKINFSLGNPVFDIAHLLYMCLDAEIRQKLKFTSSDVV